MPVLTAAVVMLAGLTAFNLILTLGILRRLRAAGEPVEVRLPEIGFEVGRFAVDTIDGVPLAEPDIANATVAFVMAGCGPCGELIAEMKTVDQSLTVFVVGPDSEELMAKLPTTARVASVADGSPAPKAFGGIGGFPTVVRVQDGRVAASGRRLADVAMPRVSLPA